MSREVMQQALDMLNEIADHVYFDQKLEGVITALEQALETKQWVGLNHFDRTLLRTTHAPLKPIYCDKDNSVCAEVVSDWDVFFDAIEAKLKEKNI